MFFTAVCPVRAAAPTTEATLASLSAQTAVALDDARRRDPEARVFRADNLGRIVAKALATSRFEIAEAIAEVASRIYPDSMPLLDARSEAREGRGDRDGATKLAARCAMSSPGNDWRASAAMARCRERLGRLRPGQ